MNDWATWLSGAIWLLPLAAVIVWLFYRKGLLSRRAFRDAPDRDVSLTTLDTCVAIGYCVLLAVMVISAMGASEPAMMPSPGEGLVMQVVVMGVPALWFVLRVWRGEAGFRRSGLLPRRPVRDLRWAGIALLAAVPLVMATTIIVTGLALLVGEPTPMIGHQMLEQMRSEESMLPLVTLLVSAVVVAPVLEEVVFRGLVQTSLLNTLGRQWRWVIVFVASLLFAVTHLGAAIWQSLAALTVLSMVLGFLYERTGSLWPSILVHAGFNAWNVAVVMWLIPPDAA
ncbi:MAG: CPBP family intramembrane glutamic endopeptidase [Phycisphaeraceae bacterium]